MSYKKILIWQVNWIGDVLFTTPFIRAVRERFPDSHIACITTPQCKEILEVNPHINEVMVYDEKTIHRGFSDKVQLIYELRQKKFDLVFLLHRSLTRAIICLLSNIRQRVGYSYWKRDFLLTNKLKGDYNAQHRIEYYLSLARKAGSDTTYTGLEFFVTDKDRAFVDKFLKENKISSSDKIVAINPGGNWDLKRWPIANYADLCGRLVKDLGVKVIITGGEKDVDLFLKIQDVIDNKLVSFCGKSTIRQLGALFDRCDVIVSGDSGPLHIALALNKNVVALFGPTAPDITGPYGEGKYVVIQKSVGCKIPCFNVECKTNKCMKAIMPLEVFEAVKGELGR